MAVGPCRRDQFSVEGRRLLVAAASRPTCSARREKLRLRGRPGWHLCSLSDGEDEGWGQLVAGKLGGAILSIALTFAVIGVGWGVSQAETAEGAGEVQEARHARIAAGGLSSCVIVAMSSRSPRGTIMGTSSFPR